MFHGTLPLIDGSRLQGGVDVQLVEGMNDLLFRTTHGCDSLVHYLAHLCPLTVNDANDHVHNILVIENQYCWTRENLLSENYSLCTGAQPAVGDEVASLIYRSVQHPDVEYNLNTCGRLYTRSAALGANNFS